MPTFSTAFTPPPALEGLTATAVGGAAVELAWSPSTLSAVDFTGYHVSRSDDGGLTWQRLADIPSAATAGYSDYAAPLDRSLLYRVTQTDLSYESDPAEVGTSLEGCAYWLVTPGAPDASFELPNVTEHASEWPLQSTEHEPIGRPRKLVERGLLLGEEGLLVAYLEPADEPVLALLRAAAQGTTELLLKDPQGGVFAVSLGTIRRSRKPGGAQEVAFRFVAV